MTVLRRPHSLLNLFALWLLSVTALSAQTYNWKPVAVKGGGFVTGVIPHPNVSGVMYCRTDIGGAYRWNPTNTSWIPILDFIGNGETSLHGVESIALDPTDSNRVYLACGWLGGGSPNAILTSTNQGATFAQHPSPFVMGANNDGRSNGERLAVDPNQPNLLLFASRYDGLWKSTNYGVNWSKVTSFPVSTTTNAVGGVFVEFIASSGTPGNPTPTIFVGVSQGGTNLFRSTNAGTSWQGVSISGLATSQMPHHAAQDGLGNMYITFCDAPGPGGVNAGSVFKLNLTTLAATVVTPPIGQGGFAGVSVDKLNPSNLVVSTINRWWPEGGDEIYRSTNSGSSWRALFNGATVDVSSAPWVAWHGTAGRTHWVGDVKMDPANSNRLFYISGGGVYSCFNVTAANSGGNVAFQFRSDGIEETVQWWGGGSTLCSPPTGPLLVTALADIGGFTHYNLDSSPPDTNFFNPVHNSNTSVDFAESNATVMVRTHFGPTRGSRSTDAGRTWTDFATAPGEAITNDPGAMVVSANGNRLVWAPKGGPANFSTNNGATWTVSTGGPTPPSWEQLRPASDRVNSNKFYLYQPSTGLAFASTDGGATFAQAGALGYWGNKLRAVFGYEGHVWMADDNSNSADGGLWRSTNSGVSFTKLANVQAANTVGFGKAASGQSYPAIYIHGKIANVWGVYRSTDQGANWTRLNDEQHKFGSISEITGDQRTYGRCYIGTGGRGVLYGDVLNQPPAAPANLSAAPGHARIILNWQPAPGATGYIVKRASVSGGVYTNIAAGLTGLSYTDSGLINGIAYYYVVAATNEFGASTNSVEVSAVPGPTPPTAWYALENNATDSSGNGNHGTATSVSYVTGKIGAQAAQFNGSSSYVSIPRSISADFTVALWVRTTDSGNSGTQWWQGKGLVDGEVSGGAVDWGTVLLAGRFALGIGNSDTTISSSVTINNGVWRHVAATRDNTTGAMKVYVDGILRGSGTGPTGERTSPPNLRIGAIQAGGGFLNGTIDDVRLYNQVLSDTEISSLAVVPPTPTGLTATAGDAQVTLNWASVATASYYQVKRAATSGGAYTVIATNVTGLSYTNTSLTNGIFYYYVVSAANPAGESANSTEASARPVSLSPVQVGFSTTGNQLQLIWPLDHTGWQLQAQTNTLNTGLGANWFPLSGSAATNQIFLPMIPTNGAVFFRLISP